MSMKNRFIAAILLLLGFITEAGAQTQGAPLPADSLRIVTYNILDGFEKDPTRRAKFIAWAREYKPDILMLNELVDLKATDLAELGREIGLPHSAQLKEEWYPVGVLSRTPVEVVNRFYYPIEEVHARKGLWHGLLHARTAGLDLLITHLSPFDTNFRLSEAKFINDYAAQHQLTHYIVAGDMNSISPYDADFTATQHRWADHLRDGDAKRKPWVNTSPTGTFDTRVISRFLDAGLYDPLPLFLPRGADRYTYPTTYIQLLRNAAKNAAKNSAPSPSPADPSSVTDGIRRRLDYILLSEPLISRCTSAQVLRLEGISDHYPVAVTLR